MTSDPAILALLAGVAAASFTIGLLVGVYVGWAL